MCVNDKLIDHSFSRSLWMYLYLYEMFAV